MKVSINLFDLTKEYHVIQCPVVLAGWSTGIRMLEGRVDEYTWTVLRVRGRVDMRASLERSSGRSQLMANRRRSVTPPRFANFFPSINEDPASKSVSFDRARKYPLYGIHKKCKLRFLYNLRKKNNVSIQTRIES